MDTQAEPTQLAQPSPHNTVVPTTTKRTSHAANQEPARRGITNQEPRISIDPMRATDRYRLVMPFDAGL